MPEKPAKKTVSVTMRRSRPTVPQVVVATGFNLRIDKTSGLVDVFLEVVGQKAERVILDPILMRSNLEPLKRYAAGLAVEQDDTALKEDLLATEMAAFSNIVHFSQMGGRAETNFGLFSITDWVQMTRQPEKPAVTIIDGIDMFVVMSTIGLQKKLLLELVLLVGPVAK